jgi:hypothetical protein
MKLLEIKRILKLFLVLGVVVLAIPQITTATEFSSANFTVKDPVIDSGSPSSSSTNFGLGQSVDQTAIGKSSSANFQLWSGFQYFFKVKTNTLTTTPGNSDVSLSWTVPDTFLGISISSYEVGTGTVSGSYTFEDVGAVTSFVKTGLTNSTPYYFIIKAKGPGGILLVFSNEATSTPVGGASTGGGGGGGTAFTVNGIAYPSSLVVLLKNGEIVSTVFTNEDATFSLTANQLASGNYNFSVYGVDQNGINSAKVNFSKSLTSGIADSVNGVIVSPTISLSHSTIKQSEVINIFGYTAPSVNLTAFVNSKSSEVIKSVNSDSTGFYNIGLNTGSLDLAEYQSRTQSMVNSNLSPFSLVRSFFVGKESVIQEVIECKRSDFNCDGRIDLVDFSILLFYWGLDSYPERLGVDIDKSGIVDLRDLSILLYDWTG